MQKKIVLFALCLLQYALVQASSPVFTPKPQPASTESEYSCNIPAPTNFQVTRLNPDAVELSWDLNPQAAGGYRIRTYRASDNALVSTIENSMDMVTAVVTGLNSGEAYYSLLNSQCHNDINSPIEASVSFFVPILELIVIGYQGNTGTDNCTLTTPGRCSFDAMGTRFRVGKDGTNYYFEMKAKPGAGKIQCNLSTNGQNQPFYFTCDAALTPVSSCTALRIAIWSEGAKVATFTATQSLGTYFLDCTFIASNHYIQRIDHTSGRMMNFGNENELTPAPTSFASPNPFANVLDVFPGRPEAQNIQLQLFNLSGQKVLDQQFGGGMEQYTLSTEGLSSGFYLLRIEADGEVQTLKVIKSE